MAIVTNHKGKQFEVTFGKRFKTNYDLEFMLFDSNDCRVNVFREECNLFKSMLLIHHLNIGCAVFVINRNPIPNYELPIAPTDNEFDLDEIYSMVEKGECR